MKGRVAVRFAGRRWVRAMTHRPRATLLPWGRMLLVPVLPGLIMRLLLGRLLLLNLLSRQPRKSPGIGLRRRLSQLLTLPRKPQRGRTLCSRSITWMAIRV